MIQHQVDRSDVAEHQYFDLYLDRLLDLLLYMFPLPLYLHYFLRYFCNYSHSYYWGAETVGAVDLVVVQASLNFVFCPLPLG